MGGNLGGNEKSQKIKENRTEIEVAHTLNCSMQIKVRQNMSRDI